MARKKETGSGDDFTEALEFDKYCDTIFINSRKDMFAIVFGQSIYSPPKGIARIWMEPSSFKQLSQGLEAYLKEYEKKHGEIK